MTIGSSEVILALWLIILIITIRDILKNEFTGNNKLLWSIFVFFGGPIGLLLYYWVGTKQKINKN